MRAMVNQKMTEIDSLIKRNCVEGIEYGGAAIRCDAPIYSNALKVRRFSRQFSICRGSSMCSYVFAFLPGAPVMVYSLRCISPSKESNIILRKFDLVQRAAFENILGVLLSDTSLEQASIPIKKTVVGIRQSADQVQAAYIGSFFKALSL